jgi:hypothetical protein
MLKQPASGVFASFRRQEANMASPDMLEKSSSQDVQ